MSPDPTGLGANKPCIDKGTNARCEGKSTAIDKNYHKPRILSQEQRDSFGQSAGDPLDTLAASFVIYGLDRYIKVTCQRWNIHPLAIIGAIAWEAFENPRLHTLRGAGLGKGHVQEGIPEIPLIGGYLPVEGDPLFKQIEDIGYLDRQSLDGRRDAITKPKIAISYIAVSLHAFSVIAEAYGHNIRSNLAVLGWVYHSKKLDSWAEHIKGKSHSNFEVTDGMGHWIITNIAMLRAVYRDRTWKEKSVLSMPKDIRIIDDKLIKQYVSD